MITPHAYHTATRLRDGKVLVTGGVVNDRFDGKVLSTAEFYDSSNGTWTATKRMSKARWGHTATLLLDGRVLVAGSYRHGSDPLASAELYDLGSGRWTATGNMTKRRGGHTATLLPDGRVLVVGGGAEDNSLEGGPRSASAEVYDPGSGKWTATGSMGTARIFHTATLLADGRVLVVNDGPFDDRPPSAELYDPSNGKWAVTASPAEARGGHTATLLLDGRVLVTGDYDYPSQASAELYDPDSGS